MKLKKQIREGDREEAQDARLYMYNLAGRIRLLEIQFEIEEENSIVKAYLRRPNDDDSDPERGLHRLDILIIWVH